MFQLVQVLSNQNVFALLYAFRVFIYDEFSNYFQQAVIVMFLCLQSNVVPFCTFLFSTLCLLIVIILLVIINRYLNLFIPIYVYFLFCVAAFVLQNVLCEAVMFVQQIDSLPLGIYKALLLFFSTSVCTLWKCIKGIYSIILIFIIIIRRYFSSSLVPPGINTGQ